MRPLSRAFAAAVFCILSFGAASHAQVAFGAPVFGTVDSSSGPDVVDLANLNVHIQVPVLHKAGRGLNFTYDLGYDNSIWFPVSVNGSQTWTADYNWGWRGITEGATGYMTYTATFSGPDMYGCYYHYYQNFVYHDGFGIPYNYYGVAEWDTGPVNECGPATFYGFAETEGGYSINIYEPPGVIGLTNRDGRTINAPINPPAGSYNAGTTTDRNGNFISVNTSGQFTDTLGTTALTVTGAGTPSSPRTFAYTAPSGASASYKLNYTAYTVATNFGVSGIHEAGATIVNLVSSVSLPDGSQYTFTYEATPSVPSTGACTPRSGTYQGNCVTGRVATVSLSTGGSITYTYLGGNNGVLLDGSTAGLTRVLSSGSVGPTWSGTWNYSRKTSGSASETTVSTPDSNQSILQFQGIYETQSDSFQGSGPTITSLPISETILKTSNLLRETQTCFNGSAFPCTGTTIAAPITQLTALTILAGSANLESKQNFLYNSYGQNTEEDDYDFGSGAPGSLLRKQLTTIQTVGVYQAVQTAQTQDGSGNVKRKTIITFDQGSVTPTSSTPNHSNPTVGRGNPTNINYSITGSTSFYKTLTFYDTGNLQSTTDVNGAQTSYTYGACGNSFPTNITEPLSPAESMAWNCNGGIATSTTDKNNQTAYANYANDAAYWRPDSTQDQLGNLTTFYYAPNASYPNSNETASFLSFGSSEASNLQYMDGLGRTFVSQKVQAPGSSTLDTVSYTFDPVGRVYSTSMPCAATYEVPCSTPKTTQTYDALGRPLVTTDGGNGTVTLSYPQNDVLVTVGPKPSGENTKNRQLEYDGLGRLTSVCEITSGIGSGACGQTTAQTGYWTKYAYDANGNMTNVTQNAQSASQQTRTYVYDDLNRMISETDPEIGTNGNGTISYTYDYDSNCGRSAGDLVKKVDPQGDLICYSYDALHRMTSTTYNLGYSANTSNRYFIYDSATVNGVSMANAKGRLAEAYTTGPFTIQNSGFESSGSLPPPGWTADYATLSYDTTSQYAGARSLKTAATTMYGGAVGPTQAGVPGVQYTISGYLKSDGVCTPEVQLMFLNSSYGYLSGAQADAGAPTSWTFVTATATAPAGTAYTQVDLQNDTAGGSGVCEFDNVAASTNAHETDLGISYTVRGEVSDTYESTPNSGGYYHTQASYYANGQVNSILVPGGYDNYYALDGEGRVYSAGNGNLTKTIYNNASQPTQVSLGSGDSDSFTYDPSTGRMTQYQYNIGAQSVVGKLGWNQNSTLASLGITDPFNSSDTQNCTYTHDDLIRIASTNCTSNPAWSQSFSFDALGNITKTGTTSFNPTYNTSTNRMTQIGSSVPTYDANGNVLNDYLNTYAWDANGRPIAINNVGVTYDALGRMVELNRGGSYTQYEYSPTGFVMQEMSGQTALTSVVPLPGGGTALWKGSTIYYRHPDWLGSSRFTSTSSQGVYFDTAYSPYGETYASSGTPDFSFTGMNEDVQQNQNPATVYDFPAREYGIQGRWPSPDPAGIGAVDPTNPQSWNRYAYALNDPLDMTDPNGEDPGAWALCVSNPVFCVVAIVSQIFEFFKLLEGIFGTPPEAAPAPPGGYGTGIDPYGTWDEQVPGGVQVFPSNFPGTGGSGCTYGSGSCGGVIYGLTAAQQVAAARQRILDYLRWLLSRPWLISWVIPASNGLGPAGGFAYNPLTHLLCGSLGAGYSEGRNFTVGPLTTVKTLNNSSVDDILKGWSVSGGYNTPAYIGVQTTGNGSGVAGGPDIGNPGFSGATTYSYCTTVPGAK